MATNSFGQCGYLVFLRVLVGYRSVLLLLLSFSHTLFLRVLLVRLAFLGSFGAFDLGGFLASSLIPAFPAPCPGRAGLRARAGAASRTASILVNASLPSLAN